MSTVAAPAPESGVTAKAALSDSPMGIVIAPSPERVPSSTVTGTSMGNGAPTGIVALTSPDVVNSRDTSSGMGFTLLPCSHSTFSDDNP